MHSLPDPAHLKQEISKQGAEEMVQVIRPRDVLEETPAWNSLSLLFADLFAGGFQHAALLLLQKLGDSRLFHFQ